MNPLVLRSPAKINFGLKILGKRGDGYHELETLLQMVSLYDTLEFAAGPGGLHLECDRPGIPTDETNLVLRAARLLLETQPRAAASGCRIRLHKVIPAGAGLGGGSGNAAAALMALNRLWDLKLTRAGLMELGARLGADVPFFMCAPAALGRGRGERLSPLKPIEKISIILVFPRVSIATSAVYGKLNLSLTSHENNINILTKFYAQSDTLGLGAHLQNDLEPVVLENFPEVRRVREHLLTLAPQGVLVSGSGSVVFAVFADRVQAKRAFARCQTEDWDAFLTETVSSFSEFMPDSVLSYPPG